MSQVEPVKGLQVSDSIYNGLKFAVQVVLPALSVFYTTMAAYWGWGYVEQIVGTLGAVALLFGTTMRVSSKNYQGHEASVNPDGSFNVTTLPDGRKSVELGFEQDPNSLVDGRVLSFVVKATTPEDNVVHIDDEPRGENLP